MRSMGKLRSHSSFGRFGRAGLGLALLLALGAPGCAEERPPINRVQAGALDKAFFVGSELQDPTDDPEFYWRNYVVDGSSSQSLVGIGSWSGVDRVRWEITESLLIARRAYNWPEGADDKGQPKKIPDGTVVAAYAIQSHFDIKRAYNASTGEESNVVEENTSDVAWNHRRYMRVDWTKNLVDTPDWDDMFLGKLFGNIHLTSVAYAVSDPAHPDAPHFDAEQGYFDITSKFYVEPAESRWIPGLPACVVAGLFTGSATYQCDPQEATIRSSFLRIDADADFEPLELTTAPLDVVGNPAGIDVGGYLVGLAPPGEQGWDPGYGFTDKLHHRFAHVHNVWKKSHQAVACENNDDVDGNGTADACENAATGYTGSLGSQCDVFTNKCTIPYRDRAIKTVGYWVNPEFPDELLDPVDAKGKPTGRGAGEDLMFAWNQLLSGAVARAREVECRRTGGDRESCHAEFFDGQEMVAYGAWLVDKAKDPTKVLTLCHNPVRSYDEALCGSKGYQARLGDLRHNFLAYWPHASRAPWGGIGNWGADPLTGEIKGAAAMIMGRSATMAAALQRDVIQVAMGDTSIEDVTQGVPASNYAHTLQDGAAPAALSKAEIDRRVASVDVAHLAQSVMPLDLPGETVADKLDAFIQMQKQSTLDIDLLTTTTAEYDALADTLRGSKWEAQLVDGHWLNAALGSSPDATAGDAMEQASPLRGLDPAAMQRMHQGIQEQLYARGVCFQDNEAPMFGSSELPGLGKYFKDKYPDGEYDAVSRGEKIYRDLWIEAVKGIAIHEVGHSLGLLHNFASSFDAPNYQPQYWQLRTHDGASTKSCEGKSRTGDLATVENDGCMGPRYLDPETDDERGFAGESRPGIQYFAQTSVMEYPLERFDETSGLGQYDAHAMKALYGRVIETMDDPAHGGFTAEEQMAFAPRLETQLTEQDRVVRSTAPFKGQSFAKPTHYTEVARLMKTFDPARCRDATPEEKAQAGWRIVHGRVCAPESRDHAAWIDFEHGLTNPDNVDSKAPYLKTKAGTKTGEGMVRWYYRYGTASNSYFHTNPSDAGADAYELTKNVIDRFDATYPWAYFRRQNREYMASAVPFSASQNVFERLRSYHWNVANRNAFYATFGDSVWKEIAGSDDWHRPMLVAETEMYGALAKVMLTPEPGDYDALATQPVDSTRTIFDAKAFGEGGKFQIGAVDGRFIGEEFDSDPDAGGSWNYQHWMRHAGFGTEKIYAAMALADGRPTLSTISRQNYLDGRGMKINFRSDMPQAVDRLLGGVLSEDWEAVGMYVGTGTTPAPTLLSLDQVDEPPTRPDGARVLFPNVGYKQQLGAMIFAQLYSRLGTDMSLVNKMRIWIDGQNGQIAVPLEQQIRFYDPASGYTYIARKYGSELIDGKSVDKGIASRMLEHANALVAASYEVEKDGNGAVVLDEHGMPKPVLDQDGLPILLAAGKTRIAELTQYVGLVDATRQVGKSLGYGPLGGGGDEE